MDAGAIVKLAKIWKTVPEQHMCSYEYRMDPPKLFLFKYKAYVLKLQKNFLFKKKQRKIYQILAFFPKILVDFLLFFKKLNI